MNAEKIINLYLKGEMSPKNQIPLRDEPLDRPRLAIDAMCSEVFTMVFSFNLGLKLKTSFPNNFKATLEIKINFKHITEEDLT